MRWEEAAHYVGNRKLDGECLLDFLNLLVEHDCPTRQLLPIESKGVYTYGGLWDSGTWPKFNTRFIGQGLRYIWNVVS